MNFFIQKDFVLSDLNFVSSERVDPALLFLSQLFPESIRITIYCLLQLSIAGIGAFLLFRYADREDISSKGDCRNLNYFLKMLIFLIASFAVVSMHPVSLRFHWFPFLLLSFVIFFQNFSIGILLFLPVALIWTISSGSLSVFGLIAAFFAAFFIRKKTRNDLVVFVAACLAIIFAYVNLPQYSFGDYPQGAQLVPLSKNSVIPNPLFGPYPKIRTILETVFQQQLLFKGLLILFSFLSLFISVYFLSSKNYLKTTRKFKILIFYGVFTIFLVLSGHFLDSNSLFALFSRIIPGLSLSALPWLLFPIFFLLVVYFLQTTQKAYITSIAMLSVLLAVSVSTHPKQFILNQDAYAFVFEDDQKNVESVASNYVVNYWGDWILDLNQIEKRKYTHLKWLRAGTDYQAVFNASVAKNEAAKAGDGDPSTRWGTYRPQANGDSFNVSFDRDVEFIKVILSIQKAPSDYPRGLRISKLSSENEQEEVIFEKENWVGPVEWTSSGKPYFGNQSKVVIDFAEPIKAQSLKFTQISNDLTFDWSVGEFKLFALPNKSFSTKKK